MNQAPVFRPHLAAFLLVSKDTALAGALGNALTSRGLDFERVAGPTSLEERLATGRFNFLLIDTRSAATPEALGALIGDISARASSKAAVACLAYTRDIRYRLAAMRAGSQAYLEASMGAEELASRLGILTGVRKKAPSRILVVDDQPVAGLFAARVLTGAGMVAERVEDPLRVLEAVERFLPDLVLMDLHMPGANGIELTGIIREQNLFADLPIVFLSCELDAHRQLEALRIGADDFLAKPVAPEQLIACVRRRLRLAEDRARRRLGVAATDPLTGLATRERLLERLDRLIGQPRAGQNGGARAAVIYLTLEADEEALVYLAAEVARRAAGSDLAARIGERAVALLARRNADTALVELAEALGRQIRSVPSAQTGDATPVGVGWCPLCASGGDALTLVSRARTAAHTALRHGGGSAESYVRTSPGRARTDDRTRVLEAAAEARFKLLFQPMVALRYAPDDRYEATLRLCTLDGELLGPRAFAAIVLEAGQAQGIDQWVLFAGLDALRQRLDAGRPVQLHLHQTCDSAANDGWADWIHEQLVARALIGLTPVIQLEVADCALNLDVATSRARELGRLGIPVCLNGLDGEERSANVMGSVPAAFVRLSRLATQGLDQGVIKALVEEAHALNQLVIATGVEGPDAIARLHLAGVDLLQGPYVQPPREEMEFDFAGTESSDHGPPVG